MVNTFNVQADQITEDTKKNDESNKKNGNIQYLNFGEDDQMEIQGFAVSKLKTYTVWFFYGLTLGILRLVFHWYPFFLLRATHTRCSLRDAQKVLIIDNYRKYKSYFVKEIKTLDACNSCHEYMLYEENKNQAERKMLSFNLCNGRKNRSHQVRIIRCKKLTYIWDDVQNTFIKLAGFDRGIARTELHCFKGQSREEQILKRIIYGCNEISVPVQTILTLLVLEALTPFYIFQLFSLIVWVSESYVYYAIAIIIMSVVGITTSIIQTRKNQKNLKGTVNSSDTATVCRGDNNLEDIPTTDLVPGDLIVISPNGCEMLCDAVLISGICVVNESMLTGESVPITKTPLPNTTEPYNVKADANHTLFCGTKVIQTRVKEEEKVCAIVIRTGYLTTKGELVRSILYPPPADFKFETDSYKFIGILAFISVLGVIYTVVSKSSRNIHAADILLKALDLITIVVPPALPAAMTVGKLYALNRLKNSKIYCINSRVINVSGSCDCICFDKTGTLTEDELDMWAVVPVEDCKVKAPVKDVSALPDSYSLVRGMASCHTLTIIDNELGGDPLDIKMFQSTKWVLEETNNSSHNGYTKSKNHYQMTVKPNIEPKSNKNFHIGIVKQFQFSSHLQRMSVIIKSSDSDFYCIYCKGSPEVITSLCKSSTVPQDIFDRLNVFTRQGYRVIALAEKVLDNFADEDIGELRRENVESNLEFVGLIILENKLKKQTSGVIRTLKDANLKVVMITGDNIQTGLHVAKECEIVETDQIVIEVIAKQADKYESASINYLITSHPSTERKYSANGFDIEKKQLRQYCFAITGTSWANVVECFPQLVPKIVAKGSVFARMSGMQKQQLIEEFKNLGYYVAMCGDGANDCGALKAAHVGISLSEAESSVASPFTSKEPNISCIPKVIKEGRAALITSFGVFKLMVCYSLTEFASVMILYSIDANLTSMQFLFIDVCLILNFASFFGITNAYETLDKTPPKTSLMNFVPISSMVSFVFLITVFQLIAYYYIQTYSWFTPFIYNELDDKNFLGYENYAVYGVSMFQYITMAVVFSKGKPYRKPLYTNIFLTSSLILTTAVCAYIIFCPTQWVKDIIEIMLPPYCDGRYAILLIAFLCFLTCFFVEDLIVEYLLAKLVAPKFRNINKSKQKYLRILRDLNDDPTWPSVADKSAILSDFCEDKLKLVNGQFNSGFVGSQTVLTTKI